MPMWSATSNCSPFSSRTGFANSNRKSRRQPEKREAQRVLAATCTAIVHGEDAVLAAEAASRILFQASDEVAE